MILIVLHDYDKFDSSLSIKGCRLALFIRPGADI